MLGSSWKLKEVSHWTPRYLFHRLNRHFFERSHPRSPNLAKGAILFLDGWLKDTDICLEYGAGHSTAWFAQRVEKIISIENRRGWYEKIQGETAKYHNVQICLIEPGRDMIAGREVSWDYVSQVNEFAPETFDFILNDGWARSYVAVRALPLLKKGGIFCWDDWLEAFPEVSRISGSLSAKAEVKDPRMKEFWTLVKEWRLVCFDDGIHSTAIFFKPF